MRLRTLLPMLLLTACSGLSAPEPEGPLTGDALVEALRDGGLVLYLRHTETTEGGVDDVSTLGDCSRQRELSDFGRQDARDLGAAVRELGVPVSTVLASPFCRTVETAELAFGDDVRTERALLALASTGQSQAEQESAQQAVRDLLSEVPDDGENTWLVGHISNVGPVTGAEPDEGGTVVFRPDGEGFRIVAEVPAQGWRKLADAR